MLKFLTHGLLASSLLLGFVFMSGCGGDPTGGVKMVPVSGTVLLDGEPMESGSLTFNPADGQGATAGAIVSNGAFSAKVPPGQKTVLVSSPKVVGQRKSANGPDSFTTIDIIENQVAPEFNTKSQLKCEIPDKGTKDLKFEVTSPRRR